MYLFFVLAGISLLLVPSCDVDQSDQPIFRLLDNHVAGIDFSNDLTYTKDFNVYKYRNFYNGGGVALGDINGDDLIDVYLVSNQEKNRLYLNKGDLKFEDITEVSGAGGAKAWSTGVTFVDINQDNLLDIYVCNSGDINGDNKENELFINNGDLSFTERASEYNLNDMGYSTHASFFDYDHDGDLDVYLLNNSYQAIGSFNLKKNERMNHDTLGGDKLMRNDGGVFVDVSKDAGIYTSVIGFGLGVTTSDFNNDGWTDIFVSNDFFERDYLYINQQDGTFLEDLTSQIHSISAASMGADAADIDNDGNSDLFVTDMLPYEYERLKTVTTFDDWDRYNYNLKNGYHRQFTRNVLQRNNGNGSFSEVSRFAGVEASDWSWGALFFDMDNDGLKDLFIANGIYKDLTNLDYLQYIANETVIESIVNEEGVNYKELIDIIPSNKVENQGYINVGNLKFEPDRNTGLWDPSFSNGSAYGDLDNDGDLDLIVNNISMPCFVYENRTDTEQNRYIKLKLSSGGYSARAIGAKVSVTLSDGATATYENIPTRGFESSMDPRINVGVGSAKTVGIEIAWPSGKVTKMDRVETNQTLSLDEIDASDKVSNQTDSRNIFVQDYNSLMYEKLENRYSDFNRERLIYHMRSNEGGRAGRGDINGDGVIDLVFPGALGQVTEVFFGKEDNTWKKAKVDEVFEKLSGSEHMTAHLLDVDGDEDLDLYLTSGGVEISEFSDALTDHLLLNDGLGHFTQSPFALPTAMHKKSIKAVSSSDIDGDGDIDIVIGERVLPGKYGMPASGFVLLNDGEGRFVDGTEEVCPYLEGVGMITSLDFGDVDGDGDEDLLMAGEFMAITILENQDGVLAPKEMKVDVAIQGWWNDTKWADIDGDGDLDIIACNMGENNRYHGTADRPMKLYVSDFDNNSFPEGVLAFVGEDGKDYPFALRHNLIDQMKGLKKKYPNFDSFKDQDMEAIFTKEGLSQAAMLEIDQLKSLVLRNDGSKGFTAIELPAEAQYSMMYASAFADFDHDGDIDIVMGGNQYNVVPEMGIYDGSYGVFLENDGIGGYRSQPTSSGFFVKGEVRDLFTIKNKLIAICSQDSAKVFTY